MILLINTIIDIIVHLKEACWCKVKQIYWFNKENNIKNPKIGAGDYVTISKYKNIYGKDYTWNCYTDVFLRRKVKNTVSWIYVISGSNGEEIAGTIFWK